MLILAPGYEREITMKSKRNDIYNLSKLTIGVFTKGDRENKLLRTVSFIELLGIRCIILDAGAKHINHKFAVTTQYLHRPDAVLEDRILELISLVRTPYLLLSPDDDFFLPNGISECIKFLEANQDYSSAQGQRIYFKEDGSMSWGPQYENRVNLDFNQEDKRSRLIEMSQSMHFIYSIIRIGAFKNVVKVLENAHSSNPANVLKVELVFNYILPIQGKHRILPLLYSARESHPYNYSNLQFADWILDGQDKGAMHFRRNITNSYMKCFNISYGDASLIEEELTTAFSKKKVNEIKKLSGINRWIKVKVKRLLSRKPKSILSRMFYSKLRVLLPIWGARYHNYYWAIWRNMNVIKFYNDLGTLKKHLRDNQLNKM